MSYSTGNYDRYFCKRCRREIFILQHMIEVKKEYFICQECSDKYQHPPFNQGMIETGSIFDQLFN